MILKIENISINKLMPYENNARKHTEEDVQTIINSIQEFGFNDPVGVWGENNIIVEGHGRFLAAKKLGIKEIPCIRLDELSDEQRKAYALAHNKTAEMSTWDFEKLEQELKELNSMELDFEMSDFGFDDILEDEEPTSILEDEPPEPPTELKTKVGDLYILGNHRLICGDSTDPAVIDRLMDGAKADMVFTDPSYGIGIDGQKESKCANPKHNRKAHEFRGWDNTRPDKSVFDYILSLDIPSVIFGGNYFADMLPATRGWIYWSKGQDGLTMSDGELAWTNVDKPLRCVTVNRANLGKTVHPTQKPLKVVEFCLDYAGGGEVVLDLFGGSGSTLIACEQLNRTCYMCELDPHYVDVIINRWEVFTGQTAELISE